MRSSTAFAAFRISTANILCPAGLHPSVLYPPPSVGFRPSSFLVVSLFLVVQGGSNSGPSLATSLLPFVGYDHTIQVSFFSMVVIISWSTFMISRIFSFLLWSSLEMLPLLQKSISRDGSLRWSFFP